MRKKSFFYTAWLVICTMMCFHIQAQTFTNDFEDTLALSPHWNNIQLISDTLSNHFSFCDSSMEYGPSFNFPISDNLHGKNLHIDWHTDCRFPDTTAIGFIVFSMEQNNKTTFWQSVNLEGFPHENDQWFPVETSLDIPADYLTDGLFKAYLWNPQHGSIQMDNLSITLIPWQLPSFLPHLPIKQTNDTLSFQLSTLNAQRSTLTHPIGMVTEYLLNNDTVTDYQLFSKVENKKWSVENDLLTTWLETDTSQHSTLTLHLTTLFNKDGKLLRQAVVIPFIDSTLTLYRRNMSEETASASTPDAHLSQSEYYLDREGFQIGEGERAVISYHQLGLSSTQFDAENRTAFFNLDYWRDHPLVHYPLSDTLEDYFEDISYQAVEAGAKQDHQIQLHISDAVENLPRIMHVPFGYESGIIFTEHADWTDIRTHRAVLFGNEHITKAKKATGGFVYYNIPVTKSVFYNNPDSVTNAQVSKGTFPGLQATIKTDREFEKLLRDLHKIGFDICLHTPEQYTTTPENLKEALNYMRRKFKSTTWIDHGYNNGPDKNREDMVCDGLTRDAVAYAADLWSANGVKYLWNLYYEENRMEQWCFNSNLMQPYPGFGDALPNRQITNLQFHDNDLSPFYTWCTPSTLEACNDNDWDFYYSEDRLQKLVEHHNIHITHIYPAWVKPGRTFWTYDEDSTIVALPGLNRALERIATFREAHKILPMTIKTYLDYSIELLHVTYEVIDAEHIRLHHSGDEDIQGFTLLCTTPISFEDNRQYESRKSGDYYYIWFKLKKNDEVMIKVINN